MRRSLLPLFVLCLACGGGRDTSATKPQPAPAQQELDEPAPAAVSEAGEVGFRVFELFQFRDADIQAPRSELFTAESWERSTFATPYMGAKVVKPDFEKEYVVGVVAPSGPAEARLEAERVTFEGGVLTLSMRHHHPTESQSTFTIRPNQNIGIPKVEGATTLVVQINGEVNATFHLSGGGDPSP